VELAAPGLREAVEYPWTEATRTAAQGLVAPLKTMEEAAKHRLEAREDLAVRLNKVLVLPRSPVASA
jgi:hypothetical protein